MGSTVRAMINEKTCNAMIDPTHTLTPPWHPPSEVGMLADGSTHLLKIHGTSKLALQDNNVYRGQNMGMTFESPNPKNAQYKNPER
jgi:hypothetical protein